MSSSKLKKGSLTLIGKLWGTTQTVLWNFFSTNSLKIHFPGDDSDGIVEFFSTQKSWVPAQYFLILEIFGVRVRRFRENFFQSKRF